MENEWKTPQSIIDYYKPYRNKSKNIKVMKKMKVKFEIEDHYEIIDAVGQGAYGIVVAANDTRDGSSVAIKKIEKAFEHKIFTKRTLRELKICRILDHENVMGTKTIILPRSREQFEDLYVVSELMHTDLASIIKSPQPLSDSHIQFFIYQILRGLKYIHSANVIHRDLKPRNLLVNRNCDLSICDFGLARAIGEEINKASNIMTDYVATRWYRAPELLLGQKSYGPPVDVWSVGCILAEILGRKSFLTGSNSMHQLKMIIDLLGSPSEEEINNINSEKFREMIRNVPARPPKKFSKIFLNASSEAIDLLKKMLVFDPAKRITVAEALAHPFLSELHLEDDEPSSEKVSPLEFEFELHDLTKEQLKDLIYEEILLYHFPKSRQIYKENIKLGRSNIQHILTNDNKNYIDDDSDGEEED